MNHIKFLSLAVGIALLFGCSSMAKKPEWVLKGSGAFKSEKKVLYGVGIAENITSEALRRTTADNRAIAEISKQLSTMSTSMMRDYMSSASDAEKAKASGDQYVENTVKTFASNTISGVKVVDRWDEGKVTYSLAELSIDDLKAMTENISQLSSEIREHIKANAEKAFDKLSQEQEKNAK
ncbi:MAG: LPP20 family lipoprotein [Endomicrobiales bacterium]|nr:LPP20 family lipoprotein [Endomicrobiales bacterium]